MKHIAWLALLIIGVAVGAGAIVAPKNGSLPRAFHDVVAQDPHALRLTGAWINKASQIREAREAYIRSPHFSPNAPLPGAFRVDGDFRFPVLLGRFRSQGSPYPSSDLQTELFDGPWPTGTLTEYYDEVSYGALNVTGTVTGWYETIQPDIYYEGASNGLQPGDARTGEFIKALLDSNDTAIDFGAYDNDGPDGVPNSGDDDGFVDLVALVHNEFGGECGSTNNMWSHAWDYRAWPVSGGQAYTTNDVSLRGGFVKVADYVIQPAQACLGGMIEIGGFCHLVGHAFGLPDLYDVGGIGHWVDGGSSGIGDWGIMGTGNWNQPATPAHPSAWTRKELGWVVPTDVGPQGTMESISRIETDPVCYRLPFTDDLFRRMSDCAITGTFSLRCALDAAEAATRGWESGSGYGNLWTEDIQREFTYDGNPPVTLSFDYAYDLEVGYDFAYVSIDVEGAETVLATYTGVGSGAENIELTSALAATPPGTPYQLHFRLETDPFQSDEDGGYLTTCGALIVDDIAVSGGGETYTNDFETSMQGWYQDPAENPATEYWLVENRQPWGFDAHLHNSGLIIYHVDDAVMRSKLGNTGGSANNTVRGVVVEEADGVGQLLQDPATTGNQGDTGDPFPGSTNNTNFGSATSPNSNDNTNRPTLIEVSAISPSAPVMTAFLKAGDPAPIAAGLTPNIINNDQVSVAIQINGVNFRHGATFRLTMAGESDILPLSVYWQDANTLSGEVNVYSKKGGEWDLVVTNPDGQESIVANAVTLVQIVAAQLVFAEISVLEAGVEVLFELYDREPTETIVVSRSLASSGPWVALEGAPAVVHRNVFRYLDGAVEPGRTYYYKLDILSEGEERELFRGSAVIPAGVISLEQNYPNPFNPNTTISFYLPAPSDVTVEIFDPSGALVRTVASGYATTGAHRHLWDGRDGRGAPVASGVYIYRLSAGRKILSRKMLLLK